MISPNGLITLTAAFGISALVIYLNERHHLLRGDEFTTAGAKWLAYGWLTVLIVGLSLLVVFASASARLDQQQLSELSFWSLFSFHLILVVFLFGWWLLSGTPPLSRFLNIPAPGAGRAVLLGLGVGMAGWMITIAVATTAGMILFALDLIPRDIQPSPLIPWMAGLPVWQKGLIILSAMTVEEAFFRGWLQKRVGLVISTIVFALSHSGYGQPLMLIGITAISLVIGLTFYKTRNLIPCVVAHGVFDAIQLFVVVPLALRFL